MYALYAVLIAVLVLVSVAVHELGHLLTAKHYGMKATEYFVGFGPKIFSFRRGETEYGLKAIPAGGYVKIIGMSPLENDGTRTPADIEAAAAAMASLPTDLVPDERRLFYTYPARQRSVVLVAGSLTHFVLALVLAFATLLVSGRTTEQPVAASIVQCQLPDSSDRCAAGAAPSAAVLAGLAPGDRIAAVDGTAITSYEQLTGLIAASAGRPLRLTVDRAGRTLHLTATPTVGKVLDEEGSPTGQTRGFLGFSPEQRTSTSLGYALSDTFASLGDSLRSSGTVITHLPAELGDVLTGKQRSAQDGAVTVVGVVRATGQVGADKQLGTRDKVSYLLYLGAQVNLDVGILNLLPLLPLDGGHVAIVWFEQLRASFARRRGRRDPGRVNLLKVLPVAYGVFAVIVVVAAILVYADIANPINVT